MRARGLVSVEVDRVGTLEAHHPALLQALDLLRGDPRLPPREDVLKVLGAVVRESVAHGERRGGVEERAAQVAVELERVVAPILGIRKEVGLRKLPRRTEGSAHARKDANRIERGGVLTSVTSANSLALSGVPIDVNRTFTPAWSSWGLRSRRI